MQSVKTVLFFLGFFSVKLAFAQSDELLVQGQTGKLFLEHTVVAKENWYSVGRLYNVSPKELAPFNKSAMTKPLVIGQTLEIPLTATNFSQTGAKVAGETLVPVYYVTQPKEWMYRISVNHNKVPYANIEKWNNITSDQLHPGMHLIVGYLKVKTALSALATRKPEAVAERGTAERPVRTGAAVGDSPKTVMPAVGTINQTPANRTAEGTGNPTAARTTEGTGNPTVTRPTEGGGNQTTTRRAEGTTNQTVVRPTEGLTNQTASPASSTSTPHFNGGVFAADFSDAGKSTTGIAGIFKSTSGWQDGRYYALMNNIAVGTIVRVTDASTNKIIYAKVLGALPDMKESNGLTIRISNAAAAELGAGEGKFNVQVNY